VGAASLCSCRSGTRVDVGVGAIMGAGDGLGHGENKEREGGETHQYPIDKQQIRRHHTHTILAMWRRSPGSKLHLRRDAYSHLRGTGMARVLRGEFVSQQHKGCCCATEK
jgi:hypothetical protein